MNSGESYSVAISPYPSSTNSANASGLIGTFIESNKPIAVNSGSFTGSNANFDDSTGQDIGIDQLVPAEIIGNEYIFVRGLGPDEVERPLIVAHEDNTEVYVNGVLQTILNASEYYSIPSTFYGVSYSFNNYFASNNPNNDGYPENIDGVPVNPNLNNDDEPSTNQSNNMYVNTSKPVFAYQVVGGTRPGSRGQFGITTGVANVGLFFVPPINCKTPSSVDNIPSISQIGNEIFGGVITVVAETGADLFINGNPISNYNAVAQTVTSNPLFESYTIEGLIGDVSIESSSQVYVATFGAYEYATFGGYYSGFEEKPEILLNALSNSQNLCIPNLTLSLSSISTYDEYQWYLNNQEIPGANSNNFTPTEPGYYQIAANISDCDGEVLSNNIPVSACPDDYDNDGVNDNIDIDNDNDGILDCIESDGNKSVDLSNLSNLQIGVDIPGNNSNNIGDFIISGDAYSNTATSSWEGDNNGNFTSFSPPSYFDSNSQKQDGWNSILFEFNNNTSLSFN